MSGMTGDEKEISPAEASDPITPASHDGRPNESLYGRAKESASSVAERVSRTMQPGDSKSTTRRLSDTPAGLSESRNWSADTGQDQGQAAGQNENQNKSMLQSAQETVAKALGGGSRGGWGVF